VPGGFKRLGSTRGVEYLTYLDLSMTQATGSAAVKLNNIIKKLLVFFTDHQVTFGEFCVNVNLGRYS